MRLYNYTVKVNYDGKTRRYTNVVSMPWERVQDELTELYNSIEELNGIITSVNIMEVRT